LNQVVPILNGNAWLGDSRLLKSYLDEYPQKAEVIGYEPVETLDEGIIREVEWMMDKKG